MIWILKNMTELGYTGFTMVDIKQVTTPTVTTKSVLQVVETLQSKLQDQVLNTFPPCYYITSSMIDYYDKDGNEIYTVFKPRYSHPVYGFVENIVIVHDDQLEQFISDCRKEDIKPVRYY